MDPKFYNTFSSIFLFFSLSCFIICQAHYYSSKLNNNNSPKPLDFLKNLNGTQKGDKAKGLSQLKKYLANLGYMNYTNPTDSNYRNDDVFDNTLEEAIKKYQKFYKLKVTGILDPQTVTLMLQPRCGVADLFITNNSVIKNSASFLYNYKYAISGYSWPPNKRNLTISFPAGTRKDAYAPVEFALTRWGNVSPFKFTYIDNFDLSDVKISFERRDHGDGYPFDGPYGILAHSFFPSDGRLHFDGDEDWMTYDEKGTFDLQTVALHELGHILGLAHSQDPKALMFAYIGREERKDITPDDIQGIQSLYPNN